MIKKIIDLARLKGVYSSIKISKELSLIGVITLLLSPVVVYGQIGNYEKYSDMSGSDLYNFEIEEDIKYGVGKAKYQKLNISGTYDNITKIDLELDLFLPVTPSRFGKRGVIIMIPSGGRSGCRNGGVKHFSDESVDLANGCDQETILKGAKVEQEGVNFNHLNNSVASTYAQRGLVVASIVTRYTYQHTGFNQDGSNRWYRSADGTDDSTNPKKLLSSNSAHLEFLVTDLKRAVRWLTANADNYNIDPNYIFIAGGSGGSKMASIAAITNENQLTVDDPANIDVAFEKANNNWGIRNSTPGIRGAILIKGDLNGTYHLDLMDTMSENTDSFMFWAGTADKSILHGMSEVIEEKCEILKTCYTQLYSLANKTHSSASSASFVHTKSGNKTASAHAYDFMVNSINKNKGELPVISISQRNVTFSESVGSAQIEITRSGDTSPEVRFTISADQMREVTLENAKQGSFDLITKYVAKSPKSDGLVMYGDSTGYAYEDAFGGNLRKPSDRFLLHSSGKGAGQYTEISSGDDKYHGIDFTGKTEVITLPSGQTSAVFNVDIRNDGLHEDNECFKVRLLNAYGARIGNSVETITIEDDDKLNPSTHGVCGNPNYKEASNSSAPIVTLSRVTKNVAEGGGFALDIESDQVVSEDVSIEYQTRTGTASSEDFTYVKKVAIIPAGQSRVDLSIQTKQDTLVEVNEQFSVELNLVTTGNAQLGTDDTTKVTIVDDDDDASSVISLSRESKAIAEGGGFVLGIEADQIVSEDVSIEYQTRTGTASSTDFTWVKKVATIPAGQSRVDVAIKTKQDTLVESNEQFSVELNLVIAGNALLGADDTTKVTIIDDDDDDASSIISLSRASKAIVEGGGFALGIVSDQVVSKDVSIEYQTRTGTASSTDFTWVKKVATIPAGQRRVDVAIKTKQDTLVESNEKFSVELNLVTVGNAQLGTANTTKVTIVDDDDDASSVISLSRESKAIAEGGGFALGIVSDQIVSEDVSIEYQTRTGTASSADFTWVKKVAIIPAGHSRVDIAIQTKQDTLVEVNEKFSVKLNLVTAGNAQLGSADTTKVTIIDDDDTAPSSSVSSVLVPESDANTALTIGLSEPQTSRGFVDFEPQGVASSGPNNLAEGANVNNNDDIAGVADVCGAPSFPTSSEKGLYIGKECVGTGDWFMRAIAGGEIGTTFDGILLGEKQFAALT